MQKLDRDELIFMTLFGLWVVFAIFLTLNFGA